MVTYNSPTGHGVGLAAGLAAVRHDADAVLLVTRGRVKDIGPGRFCHRYIEHGHIMLHLKVHAAEILIRGHSHIS